MPSVMLTIRVRPKLKAQDCPGDLVWTYDSGTATRPFGPSSALRTRVKRKRLASLRGCNRTSYVSNSSRSELAVESKIEFENIDVHPAVYELCNDIASMEAAGICQAFAMRGCYEVHRDRHCRVQDWPFVTL